MQKITLYRKRMHILIDVTAGVHSSFISLGLWVQHPSMQYVLRLAWMKVRSEATEDIAIFFKLLNEMLQKVRRTKSSTQDIYCVVCDEAGGNIRGIKEAFWHVHSIFIFQLLRALCGPGTCGHFFGASQGSTAPPHLPKVFQEYPIVTYMAKIMKISWINLVYWQISLTLAPSRSRTSMWTLYDIIKQLFQVLHGYEFLGYHQCQQDVK